jgi:hypothetical protein
LTTPDARGWCCANSAGSSTPRTKRALGSLDGAQRRLRDGLQDCGGCSELRLTIYDLRMATGRQVKTRISSSPWTCTLSPVPTEALLGIARRPSGDTSPGCSGRSSGRTSGGTFGRTSGRTFPGTSGRTSGPGFPGIRGRTSGSAFPGTWGRTSGPRFPGVWGRASGPAFPGTSGRASGPVFSPTSGRSFSPAFPACSGRRSAPRRCTSTP